MRQVVLGKHPNVVEFLGVAEHRSVGASTSVPAIVLEYVERGSLEGLLKQCGVTDSSSGVALAEPTLRLSIGRDVASGLSNIHSAGIVHNDIAARNVLVAQDYTVRGVCMMSRLCSVYGA